MTVAIDFRYRLNALRPLQFWRAVIIRDCEIMRVIPRIGKGTNY
jgi:hypothetical protein